MSRARRAALLGAVALLALAVPAAADPVRCRGAIIKSSAKHAQAAMKVLQRCRGRVLAGRLPPSADCRADPLLGVAAGKLGAGIARACCGEDGACGTPDDEPLGGIGWDVGRCPDFDTLGCDGAIAGLADVAACLACVGAAAANEMMDLTYGEFVAAPAGTPLGRCQAAIGKESARFSVTAAAALARCWAARNAGAHANPCPDPGDGRTALALARAAATEAARLAAACAGETPGAIGTVPHCPDVAIPGGASCARTIATLDDLIACVGCLGAVEAACVDRVAVPEFEAYPPECNPPPGSCSAAVTCETSLACPGGYGCQDNGGGTRYCVGAGCTTDGDCAGGGVCRPYCTLGGCGARRCQCPGFGCSGPDELCLDDGGLACRKLCTQDSDCTDPFGLVCVNPGFGFGICIGSIPCQ